jgi:DNA (cytosine-5)-methyltransferase 1
MTTQPRSTTPRSGRDSAPALVAVTTTAVRAATSPTSPGTDVPGPVVGSVCTGYGGLDLGVLAALGGGRVAWCADPDPHIAAILAARLPGIPNLGDVRAIDWTNVEPVDVLTAGFPCQDISAAGRRVGIEKGHRSGLWTDIVAGVRVLRPALLVVENVAALRWHNGGLHRVLGDLAEAGYDALWRSVRAADVGAAHRRERVFLLAWSRAADAEGGDAAHADRARRFFQRHLSRQQTGRPLVAGSIAAAADTNGIGREELHSQNSERWAVAARRGSAAANAAGDRRNEGLPGPARFEGRPDVAFSSHVPDRTGHRPRHLVAVADPGPASSASARPEVDWGSYARAVRRWEQVLGRPAPFPTQPGQHGRSVLAPAFVEWLQGLEPGWVTDIPLPRTAQLRALGNGVVPQQAVHAVALLLADFAALVAHNQTAGEALEANAA